MARHRFFTMAGTVLQIAATGGSLCQMGSPQGSAPAISQQKRGRDEDAYVLCQDPMGMLCPDPMGFLLARLQLLADSCRYS